MPTAVAFLFLAAVSLVSATLLPAQAVRGELSVADAGATSLLAYRQAVLDFLNASPAFAGTVPDAALAFTWGYRRDPRWTNFVQSGGTLYVYEASPDPVRTSQVLGQLHRKTLSSFSVGRNAAGTLVSANGFGTGIAVPAVVPDGAIVMIGR
jgi:hypothetical protein